MAFIGLEDELRALYGVHPSLNQHHAQEELSQQSTTRKDDARAGGQRDAWRAHPVSHTPPSPGGQGQTSHWPVRGLHTLSFLQGRGQQPRSLRSGANKHNPQGAPARRPSRPQRAGIRALRVASRNAVVATPARGWPALPDHESMREIQMHNAQLSIFLPLLN
jgi:hypothetical protein